MRWRITGRLDDVPPTEIDHMSSRKGVVEAYIEGFRRSDHVQILSWANPRPNA